MGKNKKETASAAQQAAQQAAPAKQSVEVVQVGDLLKKGEGAFNTGLSPDATVMALNGLKGMLHDNPKAAEYYNMPEDTVKKLNFFTLRGFATVLAIEVMHNKSEFAQSMLKGHPEAINAISEYTGVSIDIKALPEPKKDGTIEVPSSAVKITAEAKKGIKEEEEIANRKVETDPTKIENEQQLKDALLQILVKGNGSSNFYDKVVTAINFYESYLAIRASKLEDKEAALAAIKAKTRGELLTEISDLLGKCTFTVSSMAKYMYEQTERTKSPIVAFCLFRNASLNNTTGMPRTEDSLIADIVKVLIRWYANTEKEETLRVISGFEKDLEVLKKDAKKNAKAIEQGNQKIANAKNHLEAIENVVAYANVPSRELIDSFVSDYTDSSREGYKMARMIGAKIMESYYPGIKPKEVDQESLVHNLQQYMGVITNMFLPPMSSIVEYSEANITELAKVEPAKEEEKNA